MKKASISHRKMKQVNALIHEYDIECIDSIAENDGLNRSAVIRRAIKFFLADCLKNKTIISKSDNQHAA